MLGIEDAAIGFALLLFLLFIGLHIATGLFIVAISGAYIFIGDAMIRPFGTMMWGKLYNFLLVAIPLFVLMDEILVRGGVTERMYRALADWTKPLPGGLLHTNIAASTVFASISGSSVATAATIGTVAFPTFRRQNYSGAWVAGSVASGATLGILIPPSINLIIHGAITNTSIGALFTAGILPGIILALCFMLMIAVAATLNPAVAGRWEPIAPWAERRSRLTDLIPPLVIFILVMGSIHLGFATPTEASGVGVMAALVLTAFYRMLGWRMLREAMMSAVTTTGMTLLILIAAFYLNFILVVMCELALITPPVGINLYVTQSVRGRGNVGTVIAGVMPFVLCILAVVALITVFPALLI